MKKDLIIGIGFDGVCVSDDYPNIGIEIPNCVKTLHRLRDTGVRLVLSTVRSNDSLTEAVNWFKERDVELFGVNEISTNKKHINASIYIYNDVQSAPLKKYPFSVTKCVDWFRTERQLFGDNISKPVL